MGLVELSKEIELVSKTIEKASGVLKMPFTAVEIHYADEVTNGIRKAAPVLAREFQKTVNKGRPDVAIIGGACIGAAWLVAKGVDITRETLAKNKAREQLVGLYQELSVKQYLLIDEQNKIIHKLDVEKNLMQDEQAKLKRDLVVIKRMITEIKNVQNRRSV